MVALHLAWSVIQWPAVITMSSPTSVPEQKAPMGCSENFSPGQRPAAVPKLVTLSAALPSATVTSLVFHSETTDFDSVCMAALDS